MGNSKRVVSGHGSDTYIGALFHNFMGQAPNWYKILILGFLVLNVVLLEFYGPKAAGWGVVLEFIFCLAMALKCYPLLPGGLIALQSIIIGLTTPAQVEHEVMENFDVILLLVFMVAGIHFMKNLLGFVFTKILVRIESKMMLSLAFLGMGAFLSAFLDALTVVAVVIAVAGGFYAVVHKVRSGKKHYDENHDITQDEHLIDRSEFDQFRAFLRSLLMHACIGTALGGVCTMVGEPQNLVIAEKASWDFWEFFFRMAPVSIPVFIAGVLTCILLEKFKFFDFGTTLPEDVRNILRQKDRYESENLTKEDVMNLFVQGIVGVILIISLATHVATVGFIGLMVIVLLTIFNGVSDEHTIGDAFKDALPFTALLVVFFVVVAVIIDQKLFAPVIEFALSFDGNLRYVALYLASGLLSMVSDNVFVGTVYINEVYAAWQAGSITRDQFDQLAVAINTGTNLPSVATPNGQAAFLFLLTSAIAPLLRLSYMRMVLLALPFTVILTVVGGLCNMFVLPSVTEWMYANELISHHAAQAVDAVKSVH